MLAQTFTADVVTGSNAINVLIGLGVSSGFFLVLISLANVWAKSKTAKLRLEMLTAEAAAEEAIARAEKAKAEAEAARAAAAKSKAQAETLVKGVEFIADRTVRDAVKATITKFSKIVNKEGEVDELVQSLGLKKGTKPEIKSPEEI